MSVVDHEAVLRDLKRWLATECKQGVGVGRALEKIGRLEAEHVVEEHLLTRTLRVYGNRLQDALAAARDEALTEPREDPSSPPAEAAPPRGMVPAPAHRTTRGGHDVNYHPALSP